MIEKTKQKGWREKRAATLRENLKKRKQMQKARQQTGVEAGKEDE